MHPILPSAPDGRMRRGSRADRRPDGRFLPRRPSVEALSESQRWPKTAVRANESAAPSARRKSDQTPLKRPLRFLRLWRELRPRRADWLLHGGRIIVRFIYLGADLEIAENVVCRRPQQIERRLRADVVRVEPNIERLRFDDCRKTLVNCGGGAIGGGCDDAGRIKLLAVG